MYNLDINGGEQMKVFNNALERKEYMRQVRQRLASRDYGPQAKVAAEAQLKGYYVNSKLITGEELFMYYNKIKEIEESGLQHFAIGKLIDKDIFDKMTAADQQRYVMELANLYKSVKSEYLSTKKIV